MITSYSQKSELALLHGPKYIPRPRYGRALPVAQIGEGVSQRLWNPGVELHFVAVRAHDRSRPTGVQGDSGTGFRALRADLAKTLEPRGACICGVFSLEF